MKEHQDADDDEDWEDVSMSDRDRELFLHEKLHLTEPVRGWRRLVILMLTCQSQVATEVAIALAIKSKKEEKSSSSGGIRLHHRLEPSECNHPYWMQRRGGNQYATYSHCFQCGERTHFARRNRPSEGRVNQVQNPDKVNQDETHDQQIADKKKNRVTGKVNPSDHKAEPPTNECKKESPSETLQMMQHMTIAMQTTLTEGFKSMAANQKEAQEQQTQLLVTAMDLSNQRLVQNMVEASAAQM